MSQSNVKKPAIELTFLISETRKANYKILRLAFHAHLCDKVDISAIYS